MMKKAIFFTLLLLITFSSLPAWAQQPEPRGEETQIGVRFTGASNSLRTVKGGIFGVGADAIVDLGEYFSVRGLAQVERIKPTFSAQPFHLFTADTDLRLSPMETNNIHFFGAAGVNLQRLIAPYGSQNFFSPTLGGGVGYGRFGHLLYKRGFPDMTSRFAKRFDRFEANFFGKVVPTSKWRARFGGFYERTYLQNSAGICGPTNWSSAGGYLGFSRVVGKR